jgi:hypothetical protein
MLLTLPTPSPADHSTAPVSTAEARYGFAGVAIGATMTDLHNVRPKASCTPEKSGVVDCIAPDQPLGGGYFARDLSYRFVEGRLAQIRFKSSIDGFAFVVARLRHDFGAPADIRRDNVRLYGLTFPHVAFTWRNGRSTIQMSDPVTLRQLAVTITIDTQKSRLGGAAA